MKRKEGSKEDLCKKFRFQGCACLLTYKTWLDKKQLIEYICGKVKKDMILIRAAHETGDENHPYLHTHVVFYTKVKWECKNERALDVNGIHPNWSPINPRTEHLKNAIQYLGKEDKENEDLLEWEPAVQQGIVARIQASESRNDAIDKFCINDKGMLMGANVSVVERLYFEGLNTYEPEIDENMMHVWQKWLLKKKNDNRCVVWVYDYVGGCGKTVFGKYIQHNKLGVYLSGSGNGMSNVANYAQTMKMKGENLNWWILNMSRVHEDNNSIYSIIEMLKDGIYTSTKYTGCNMLVKSPAVTVMANSMPKFDKLSLDRWCVVRISNEKREKCFDMWVEKQWIPIAPEYVERKEESKEDDESKVIKARRQIMIEEAKEMLGL